MDKQRFRIDKNEKLIALLEKRNPTVTNNYTSGDNGDASQVPQTIMGKPVVIATVPRNGQVLTYDNEEKEWIAATPDLAAQIDIATAKTPLVDTDTFVLTEPTTLKKTLWSTIKSTLKTYFDGLYLALSGGTMTGDITMTDGEHIILGTTSGSKVGTATSQKLGFFNATPIVQPVNTIAIDNVLVNLGLRASGGTSNFATAVSVPSYERHIQIDAKSDGTVANQPLQVDFFTAGGLQFNQTNVRYAFCQWEIPDDWDGTDVYIEIDWFPDSGAISGTAAIRWTVEYRAIAEGEDINNGTSVTLDNGTNGDTGDYRQYQTKHTRFTLPHSTGNQPLTKQDHIYFKISRDVSVTGDFNGTVTVLAYEIIYNSVGIPTSN